MDTIRPDNEEVRTFSSVLEEITVKDSELKEVKIGLDSFGPWSNSKYKCLKKCPFQFYLKYVLKIKIPEKDKTQADLVSPNVGKAAHQILEHIVLGKSMDKAFALTRKEYHEDGVLDGEGWARVEALRLNIETFKERLEEFDRMSPIGRIFTEIRIGVTREFEPTGFFSDDVWLRGIIDLVLLLDCKDVILVDHKTGGGQGSIAPYEEQLDWYKVLFHFGIQKVRGGQSAVHFIAEGINKMAKYHAASDIENTLKNSLIMSLEGALEMLTDKGYFKHVRGSQCKWCEYDNVGCKSGALKPLELKTKRWIEIHKANI